MNASLTFSGLLISVIAASSWSVRFRRLAWSGVTPSLSFCSTKAFIVAGSVSSDAGEGAPA